MYMNYMASPFFYRSLRKVAKENGVPFIVNETHTGMGITGKFWGHDHWYLEDQADIVTFGNRQGLSGFFSNTDFRTNNGGDPSSTNAISMLQNGAIFNTIVRKKLLEHTLDTSTFLKIELARAAEKGIIHNVRGYGCFIGFDCRDAKFTNKLQMYLQRVGINVGRIGVQTLGLRPALVLRPHHAAHLREALFHFSPHAIETSV